MPELPEVETIVRELRGVIAGKSMTGFFVSDTKKILRPRLSFPLRIRSVMRHGKYIVCEADSGMRCLIHLRMTGELLFERTAVSAGFKKHERAAFCFADGSRLRFVDVRRFGTVAWLSRGLALPALGLDPLSPGFTAKALEKLLHASSRPVKSLLLDQAKIAGVGNIYADEALWTAKLHPARSSRSIKMRGIGCLRDAIRAVLREGIERGGFTLRDYRRIDGSFGYYQKSRKAYDREGEACVRCGARIRRMKIGGRSSYFCPRCQKKL